MSPMSHFYKQPPQVAPGSSKLRWWWWWWAILDFADNYLQVDTAEPLSRVAANIRQRRERASSLGITYLAGQDKHSAKLYVVGIQDLAGIKLDTNDS